MICLGYPDTVKLETISIYRQEHGIRKTVVISADDFPLVVPDADQVKYSDVIMYVTFYRLMQEITPDTLVVLNECLRTQNRYDLSYNCIRNFLRLTPHRLIFQLLPQIDTREDFMVLFDWETDSRWKRRHFDPALIAGEAEVHIQRLDITFHAVGVETSEKTKKRYERVRDRLFADLGSRDPHILPRQLYLIGGEDKRRYIDAQSLPLFGGGGDLYLARNRRLNRDCICTYDQVQAGCRYTVVEFPHRFIEFSDFIQRTGQTQSQVLLADLKVDHWYFNRYTKWAERIHDTYADLPA